MRHAARLALARPIARVLGRKRRTGGNEKLDPQIAAVLELERLLRLPALDSMEPAAARKYAEAGLSPLDVTPAKMATITDITVTGRGGQIPVRLYVPPGAGASWLVYFHGGGGVIGSIRSSEPATRFIAEHTKCTVASVEYRLGPEHKHPAAIEDAVAAYVALVARVPAGGKIAVAGDSFGGFLAAHVDHAARATAVRPPDLQVLVYPLVDLTLTSPSLDRNARGYLLTRSMIHWFIEHYMAPCDDRPASSPKFWPDTDLRASAPTIVATAGYDPLVDEGDAYAATLAALGVPVRHHHYTGLVHGFLSLAGGVDAARGATVEICRDIVEMLKENYGARTGR